MRNSPLDSFKLTFEKQPLFKEKRYRGPLPKPPWTSHMETGLRWVLNHPLYIASIIVFSLFAPLTRTYALEPQKPVTAPQNRPQTVLMLPPLADTTPPPAQELEQVYIPPPTPPPAQSYSGTGDYYLDWIINTESSGNPYIVNSIGACGLGQSLPCSKVLSACGSLSNVSCQVDWIRNYCIQNYGSTYGAYLFHLAHGWY